MKYSFRVPNWPEQSRIRDGPTAASRPKTPVRLPVDLAHDGVETPEGGDHVGDVLAFGHLGQRLEVREAGTANLEASGFVGAVRADVDTEFALGGLDRAVDLGVGVGLERPRDVGLDLAVVLGPVFEQVDTLLDDLRRLLQFPHPHQDASVDVAFVLRDDVPVEFGVVAVGVVAPEVVVDARPASHGAGNPVLPGGVGVEMPDVDTAFLEQFVARQQVVVLLEFLGEVVEERTDAVEELLTGLGHVPGDTAQSEVVEHHPLAGEVLQDVLDDLPVPHRVHEDDRELPEDVQRERADGDEVVGDAGEFPAHGADDLGVLGDLDVREIFRRPGVGPLVQ